MGKRRVLIVDSGSVATRLAVALAMKDIEAQVLLVGDDSPPPKLTIQRGDNAPTPALARERRKAQWKNEIHGIKKP